LSYSPIAIVIWISQASLLIAILAKNSIAKSGNVGLTGVRRFPLPGNRWLDLQPV